MSEAPFVSDLSGVCRVTEDLAGTLPPGIADTAREVLLRRVDSVDEMTRLQDVMPGLPPVYESVASAFDLFGVSLGYFQLWPSPTKATSLAGALLEAFEGRSERWVAGHGDLIEVGGHVGDPLCVLSRYAVQPDRVVILDHSDTDRIDAVATDFEQLLVLAGNVVAIRLAFNAGRVSDPRSALAGSVAALCEDSEIQHTWSRLGRQAF